MLQVEQGAAWTILELQHIHLEDVNLHTNR